MYEVSFILQTDDLYRVLFNFYIRFKSSISSKIESQLLPLHYYIKLLNCIGQVHKDESHRGDAACIGHRGRSFGDLARDQVHHDGLWYYRRQETSNVAVGCDDVQG